MKYASTLKADAIGHRSACYEAMGNNVAAYHDCNAALLYGKGSILFFLTTFVRNVPKLL